MWFLGGVLKFFICGVVLFCFVSVCLPPSKEMQHDLGQVLVKIVVSKPCSNSSDRPQGSDQPTSCALKSCCHKGTCDRLVRPCFGFALHCFKNEYMCVYICTLEHV